MKSVLLSLVVISLELGSQPSLGLQSSFTSAPNCYRGQSCLYASTIVESSTTSTSDDAMDTVEFPPPLSKLDRLQRAATFWSKALPIVANYYGLIGSLKLQEILGEPLAEEKIEKLWDEKHEDGARKLYQTVADLKGFYVKTAQIISSRQDLFPKQYTDALSDFTDNVDPMPASLAKAVVKQELLNADESFEDIFAEFDEEVSSEIYFFNSE